MEIETQVLCVAQITLACAAFLMKIEGKTKPTRNKNRKKYSLKWLLTREDEGFSHKLLREIQCEDTKLYRNILRMTAEQFQKILLKVGPLITKKDTNLRNAIGPAERLHLTLRYLATGETQISLQLPFRIQQSTISKILKETIPAIYEALHEELLKFPDCENEWRKISNEFFDLWGYPNALGAIDGKHCKIKPLKKAGSTYFNYKGHHSFILMAIADAQYRFLYVDIGVNGRVGDAGVWLRSDLKYAIEQKKVNIPTPDYLPLSYSLSPFTFLSDDAFALTEYMMKPYSHIGLTPSQTRFNKMLSRSRRVVENAFGILANRFQVLFSPIYRDPERAVQVVLAAVCLHNFLRTENIENNCSLDTFPSDQINYIVENNFTDIVSDRRKPNKNAEKIRDNFKEYFSLFSNENE